jgi:hypothetical protein
LQVKIQYRSHRQFIGRKKEQSPMQKQTSTRPEERTNAHPQLTHYWLPLLTLAINCYNVGVILQTQLSFQLWSLIGRTEFDNYHRAWWFGLSGRSARQHEAQTENQPAERQEVPNTLLIQGIKPLFIPASTLSLLGALAQLRWRSPRVPLFVALLGLVLHTLIWGLTAIWWGPWQARLKQVRQEDGTLNPLYQCLLSTHWLRVALVTALGALQFWVVGKSLRSHER